jgi:hypothetical protein
MNRNEIEDLFLPFVQRHITIQKLIRLYWNIWSLFHPVNGVKVMEETWDYLIILDACRYDFFKKYNNIVSGNLQKKLSLASCTYEWLEKNFAGSYFPDTVYITANPRIHTGWFKKWILHNKNPFFQIEDVWKYAWNEKSSAVPPSEMTKATIKIIKKNRSKRVIIHYLQPHPPYLDENNERIIKSKKLNPLRRGEVSRETAIEAYAKNLLLVLKEVKQLTESLNGRIIITADHGECFGEWLLFSHPGKTYVRELIEVPWLVINKNTNEKTKLNRSIRNFIKK